MAPTKSMQPKIEQAPPKPAVEVEQQAKPPVVVAEAVATPKGPLVTYTHGDFVSNILIFPIKDCFENLPIIFRKFGTKSITIAKINIDTDNAYNLSQSSTRPIRLFGNSVLI